MSEHSSNPDSYQTDVTNFRDVSERNNFEGSDQNDESDDLTAVEFERVDRLTWQVVLCDGSFANLVIALSHAELRIYPSPHPFNWDNPKILSLSHLTIPDDPQPDAVPAEESDEFDYYIRIPTRTPNGETKFRAIAVDADNIVPYVRIRTSETQDWQFSDFSDYVVHFKHPEDFDTR